MGAVTDGGFLMQDEMATIVVQPGKRMRVPKWQRERMAEFFDLGFVTAWSGAAIDDSKSFVRARGVNHATTVGNMAAAFDGGYDACLRFMVALGGRKRAKEIMRKSPRMAEMASRAYDEMVRTRKNGDGVIVGREPCTACQWIAGCADTGWACGEFRRYVGSVGAATTVPDAFFDSEDA